jgi:hypothetical protein
MPRVKKEHIIPTAIRGIRVVERRRGNVLVEWYDEGFICRGWLREQKDGWIPNAADLTVAAPFGDPLEEALPDVNISPKVLADALRRDGIWTVQDAMKDSVAVARAIAQATKLDVASVQASLMRLNSGN